MTSNVKHGRRRARRNKVPPPMVVSEWGEAGPPADYDPGAPTSPLEIGSKTIIDPAGEMEYPQGVAARAELVSEVSSGEGTELPHWADPPTGEVPRALAGQPGEDELQAWRLLGSRGLHWRDDVNNWSNGPGVEDLVDENDEPVTPPPTGSDRYSFDEEFERLEQQRNGRAAGSPYGTPPGGAEISGAPIGAAPIRGTSLSDTGNETGTLFDVQAEVPQSARGAGAPNGVTAAAASSAGANRAGEEGAAVNPRPLPPPPLTSSSADRAGSGGVGTTVKTGRRRTPLVAGRNPGRTAEATAGEIAGGPPVIGPRRSPRPPYDVGAEVVAGGPSRDVGAAIATGIGLLVLFVGCYLIGATALMALSALIILGCALEAFAMLQRAGFRPATLVAGLGSAGAVLAAYWRGTSALPVVFVVVLCASLVWYLARVVDARPVVNVAVTVLGFAWVGVLGSFAGLLLAAHRGEHLFLGAVVPTVVADMAAWFGGSRFGSHHMAPVTSPGKTWEGFVAGAVAAVVAGAIIGKEVAPWGGAVHGVELGVLVAITAPIGDLVQSMIKRDLRLKDSGSLLPGHGGLLDRFDSLLFVLPATYFLATVLHIVR